MAEDISNNTAEDISNNTQDISNKTIVVLVILTVIISMLGTFVVLSEVGNIKLPVQSAQAAANVRTSNAGQVSLEILEPQVTSSTGYVALEIK